MPVENSVFISYRRTNSAHARLLYQNLRLHSYDVFMDVEDIDAGEFGEILLNQIAARAHFLLILTPSALERCHEPDDWVRREIEHALATERNIIPLLFDHFDVAQLRTLTGTLSRLQYYNTLHVPWDYFDAAMTRLFERFLNQPVSVPLQPTPRRDAAAVRRFAAAADARPAVTEAELSAYQAFERAYALPMGEAKVREYSEVLRQKPDFVEALYNRALAYARLGRPGAAITDYTEVLRLRPDDAVAYHNRALAYADLNALDAAIADFDIALRLKPDDAAAYYNRGSLYAHKGMYPAAEADFEAVLRLSPGHAEAEHNLRVIRRKRQKI
ncbi:MAG: hypothetical protein OHK0046_16100 [Anaerolineae bacterium]